MKKFKPEPLSFDEARDALPFFHVGTAVKVAGFCGVLEADRDITPTHDYRPVLCRVEGIRLDPDAREEWDDEKDMRVRVVNFRMGWQYLVVGPTGSEWGWVSEAELLAKGYKPPHTVYSRLEEACIALLKRLRQPGMPPGAGHVLDALAPILEPVMALREATGYVPTYASSEEASCPSTNP